MALVKQFLIFVAMIFPVIVSAKDFIVGDESGWTTKFDYQAWADGKDFRVGDRLVFRYPEGVHNVFKVNGTGFQNCIIPSEKALTSGNDVIVLATPGRKWYICGVGNHCAVGGQRLRITVNSNSPAPTIAPTTQSLPDYGSSGNCITANLIQLAVAAFVAIMFVSMA